MKRALLAVAAIVFPPVGVLAAPAPPASAAPGGDVSVVVQSVTWGSEGTATVLCPAGSRALGGGAAPVSPAATTYASRFRTDGPVDSAGGTISAGEAPGGWQVVVSSASGTALGAWKVFVTCSATSDVVADAVSTGGTTNTAFTLGCPAGSRAVGGGYIGDGTTQVTRSGPLGAAPDQFGSSPDGTVPTRWRVDLFQAAGGGAVVLCSATADATVQGAALSTPGGAAAGVATAGCPAGQRAVAGGLTADAGQLAMENRLGFAAPVATLGDLATIATGAVPQAWTLQGRGGGGTGYRVYAVCVTSPSVPPPPPAPVDTTPPDTTISHGPARKTTKTKAAFTFTSEPGATFTCRLDQRTPVACTSPFQAKELKKGKHTLTVTARDAAGNVDPSPATWTWKVKKKRMPK